MEKEIHHKIAGIIIKDRKLLMCRKYDEPHFIMPGGRIIEGESFEETLRRELREELNVELDSMKFFKSYEAPHFKDKNKTVKMDCYFAEISGVPRAANEINEINLVDSNYIKKGVRVASIDEDYLIPDLKKLNLIE